MTNPPNPIHTHPEGPPGDIPLREYVEGRLGRLAADSSDRTGVLRELYDREINGLTRLVEQRFTAMEAAVEKALTAQQTAVSAALAAVERESKTHAEAHDREHQSQAVAIEKAEKRADERFEDANHFRTQIESERATYARIDMIRVVEGNARTVVEKLDVDMRARLEKSESDARNRLEKVEADLRQRIDVETKARTDALAPLVAWMQRSGGQLAVWVALAGVAVTVILAVVIWMANWATR